jgi:enoyl-CoA hydratase/carnithine racemase
MYPYPASGGHPDLPALTVELARLGQGGHLGDGGAVGHLQGGGPGAGVAEGDFPPALEKKAEIREGRLTEAGRILRLDQLGQRGRRSLFDLLPDLLALLDVLLALAPPHLGLHGCRSLGQPVEANLEGRHLLTDAALGRLDPLHQLLELLIAESGELIRRGEQNIGHLQGRVRVGHVASLHKAVAGVPSRGGADTGELVGIEREGRVAWITIDHPPANSLSNAVLAGLRSAFAEVAADESLRAVVLTGTGDRFFVAGADINEFLSQGADGTRAKIADGQQLTLEMERQRYPIVAAINGFALGGGLELAMTCDLRVASSTAKLGQPEVLLGIIPGWGGTQRLPRLVGRGRALEMLLSGEQVSVERALEIGLVNRVVPPEDLHNVAQELASRLAEQAPLAVAAIKRAVSLGLDRSLAEGLAEELREFDSAFRTSDAGEGISAFLEKRRAQWTGA